MAGKEERVYLLTEWKTFIGFGRDLVALCLVLFFFPSYKILLAVLEFKLWNNIIRTTERPLTSSEMCRCFCTQPGSEKNVISNFIQAHMALSCLLWEVCVVFISKALVLHTVQEYTWVWIFLPNAGYLSFGAQHSSDSSVFRWPVWSKCKRIAHFQQL